MEPGLLILCVSLLLQATAALLALRLVVVTGRRAGWILISLAILLMGVRRAVTLANHLSAPLANPISFDAELVALVISILMLGGLAWIAPFFRSLARTRAALRARERQQAAIAELGRMALGGATVDQIVTESVTLVARTMELDLVKVLECLPGDEALLLRAGVGWDEGLVGSTRVPAGTDSQAGFTLKARRPVVVEDLRSETRFTGPRLLHDHGVVSGVSVPIGSRTAPYGVLGAHSRARRRFAEDDVHFLEAIAHVLADAITRAREKERLEETVEQLRSTEVVLRRSEAQKRAAWESALDGILTMDAGGRILDLNPAAEKIFSIERDEVIGRPLADVIVPPALRRDHHRGLARYLESGESHILGKRVEMPAMRSDGTEFPAELTVVEMEGGPEPVFLGTVRDVTERQETRALEEQLRQKQKLESIGRLAAGIAHDFNNLLTVQQGYLSLMLDRPDLSDELRRAAEQIAEASERGATLVAQLLTFSRKHVFTPRRLDLNDVVREVVRLLERILGEDITLTVECHPAELPVEGDAGMIEQVLMNLAINARDAMPTGGRLEIATRPEELAESSEPRSPEARPGRFAVLRVVDNGSGISSENLDRIFDPFFTTKEVGQGTGLGLATLHGIVSQHGGWVEVESRLDEGSRFDVFLPSSGPRTEDVERRISRSTEATGGGETVLLVEDEPLVQQMTTQILEQNGYEVIPSGSGAEALEEWRRQRQRVDLLLTDMVMPGGITGRELAERLWREAPDLPVVFTSGYTTEKAELESLAGRATFLQKPYTPDELLAELEKILAG